MFIHTNQPLITSFYIKKLLIFCRISDESALSRNFLHNGRVRGKPIGRVRVNNKKVAMRTSLALIQASLTPWAVLSHRSWTAGPATTQKDHSVRVFEKQRKKSKKFWHDFQNAPVKNFMTNDFPQKCLVP